MGRGRDDGHSSRVGLKVRTAEVGLEFFRKVLFRRLFTYPRYLAGHPPKDATCFRISLRRRPTGRDDQGWAS